MPAAQILNAGDDQLGVSPPTGRADLRIELSIGNNLVRRPTPSVLTFAGPGLVVLLVSTVVGFNRGLENSLTASGDPRAS